MEKLAFLRLVEQLTPMLPYLPLLTVGVAILGWLVIIKNTKSISSRSETHALVLQILSLIDSIDKMGRAFWGTLNFRQFTEEQQLFEADVLNSIEALRQVYEMLERRKLHVNIAKDFSTIRSSLTLDVEKAEGTPLSERLEKAASASAAARKLKTEAYSLFLEQYKPVT